MSATKKRQTPASVLVRYRRFLATGNPSDLRPDTVETIVPKIVALAGEPPGYRELAAPHHPLSLSSPAAADAWLTYYDARYRDSKNPVFVWEALGVAIGAGVPVPEWVAAYLYRVADQMHALSRSNIPETDLAAAVFRALDFVPKRGVNPFRAITDASHDFSIAVAVWEHLRRDPKLDAAIFAVATEHPKQCQRQPRCESVSYATVRRLWLEHGAALPK